MKNKIKMVLFFVVLIIFPLGVSAEIVLEEDFDDWNNFYSNQCPPEPWCDSCGCTGSVLSVTISDVTHSPTEITAPGYGGSGKSMKTWRNGMTWVGNNYYGSLGLRPIVGHFNHNALYFRWYLKAPTSFVFQNGGQKMFRYNISDGGEIYFNFYDQNIKMCPNSGGADCWADELPGPASNWHDGDWHAHQLYVNLANSTVTYWLDGVQTYHKVGVDNMPSTSAVFGTGLDGNFIQHFPFGNSFDQPYPNSWQSFEMDNLVIATTKAETDPLPTDLIAPNSPTGLSVL